jgi:hypothetical protein
MGFVLTIWPTCRGPWRPAASDLTVASSNTPGSAKLKDCPACPRRTSPRRILSLAQLREFYGVLASAVTESWGFDDDSYYSGAQA